MSDTEENTTENHSEEAMENAMNEFIGGGESTGVDDEILANSEADDEGFDDEEESESDKTFDESELEASLHDDVEAEDDESDEMSEEDEQGEDVLSLDDVDTEQVIDLGDGETATLEQIIHGYHHRLDRDSWLEKNNELAAMRQEAEQTRDRLGDLASALDNPHRMLGSALENALRAGYPAEFIREVDAIHRKYEERGEINVDRFDQAELHTQKEREMAEREEKLKRDEYGIQAKADHASIVDQYGPISQADGEKLEAKVIEHMQKTGEFLSLRDAFDDLRKAGEIKVSRKQTPSARKAKKQLRRNGTSPKSRPTSAPISEDQMEREMSNFVDSL